MSLIRVFSLALIIIIAPVTNGETKQHSGVLQIFSGPASQFTCALMADQRLTCWGSNNWLSPTNYTFQEQPKPRSTKVVTVAAGYGFACELLLDATVWCWGSDDRGQLGNGKTEDSVLPQQVMIDALTPLKAISIAAGSSHACAVSNDLTVWCWGSNSRGQLGDYRYATTYLTASPQLVVENISGPVSLKSALSVTAGSAYTCVSLIPSAGSSLGKCWGENSNGQLGAGTISTYQATPSIVGVSSSAQLRMRPSSLSAGAGHTCAVVADGTTACWGDNSQGADATNIGGSYGWAAPVYNGSTIWTQTLSLAVGGGFTCVLQIDHAAACWGANRYGQVGHYPLSRSDALSPYPVLKSDGTPLTSINTVVSGSTHACALLADSTIRCWGDNSRAQTGQGMFVRDSDYPADVPVDAPLFTDDFEN